MDVRELLQARKHVENRGESTPAWSTVKAFLLAWVRPATATRRTGDMPLTRAYAVHLAGLLIAAALGVSAFHMTSPRNFEYLVGQYRPLEWGGIALGTLVAIEAGTILLGAMVAAWGAVVEPLTTSFRHAMRQVWLHTPHTAVCIFLASCAGICLLRAERNWAAAHPMPALVMPPISDPDHMTQEEFNEIMRKHVQESRALRETYQRSRPWYSRYSQLNTMAVFLIGLGWILWSLLRGVNARVGGPQTRHALLCEFCGYNLSMAGLESMCPECGEPVARSLGESVRSGPPWARRARIGRGRAYLRTASNAFFRPHVVGRQILLFEPPSDHRGFLLLHLFPIGIVSVFGSFMLSVVTLSPLGVKREWEAVAAGCLGVGGLMAMGSVLGTCAMAGIVGLGHWLRDHSMILPGTMQGACYLSGALTVWIALAWASGILITTRAGMFGSMAAKSFGGADVPFLLWTALMMGCGALYTLSLWHIGSAVRYANH